MKPALYVYPGGDGLVSVSPPCVKVDLALRRLGIDHDVVVLKSGNAAAANSPTGRLPALRLGETTTAESCRILDRLEREFPDGDLWIRDPGQRDVDYLWDRLFNDHLYWHGFYLRWFHPETSRRFLDRLLENAPGWIRLLAPLQLPREMRRRALAVGVGRRSYDDVLATIRQEFERVDRALGTGPFLQGRPTPARGDLSVASVVAQAGFKDTMPQVMEIVSGLPRLAEHSVAVYEACGSEVPRWLRRT